MHLAVNLTGAEGSDFERIQALLTECHLPIQDLTLDHLRHFLILQNSGDLIGVVGLEPKANAGLLRSLAVQTEFRGQGLAGQLVAQIESHAVIMQISTLYLLTTTAKDFFIALGYTLTDRQSVHAAIQSTAEFAEICPASSTCLMKQVAALDHEES